MDLDSVISNKLKRITKRTHQYRTRSKDSIHKSNIKQAIRLVKTGELNIQNKSHRTLLVVAHKAGFINRYTLEILKEL